MEPGGRVVTMGLAGRWRIEEMELWDPDAIDLVGPGFVEFKPDGSGTFRFIVVEGDIDGRFSERDGQARVEFSWSGTDEGDPVSGRGWADLMSDGALHGRLFIHFGDDSWFRASRWD